MMLKFFASSAMTLVVANWTSALVCRVSLLKPAELETLTSGSTIRLSYHWTIKDYNYSVFKKRITLNHDPNFELSLLTDHHR